MRAALLAAVLVLAAAAPAAAAPRLTKIGDFASPVHVASPPGDVRLFVVEQGGLVKLVDAGGVRPEPFLDVTALTDGGGERGLLSIAFAPDYPASGLFYVFLTAQTDGALRVLEYRRSADPGRADPSSGRQLLSIPHPRSNHNGGQLQFGPDGFLYVGTGDGGGSDDPDRNAQDLGSLLGKILRLDARSGAAAPGNPFGSAVWAYGLRNPWRFSFDRATGDLVIGDVGQGAWEEVDWVRAADGGGRGANFGWPCFEGSRRNVNVSCDAPGAVPPAFERSHADGYSSITGGYVVRSPGLPSLAGRYLYGDIAKPSLRSTTLAGDDDREEPLAVPTVVSFGEDHCGQLYAVSHGGAVYRIDEGTPPTCAIPVAPAPPATPGPAADVTAPRLRARLMGARRAARTRRLRLALRCDEPCRATVATRLRGVRRLATRRRSLAANRRTVVRVKFGRKATRRLRRTLRRKPRVIVAVSVRARDAAGNRRVVRRRAKIYSALSSIRSPL
jgi:glucose/arabinose dehydrogenase